MAGGDGEARVSEADRERAVERLREVHVDGRMTLEELSDRAELAYRARTGGELARATAALPASAPASRKRPTRRVLAIFAGRTLSGPWQSVQKLTAFSFCGGTDVDMRQATLDPDGLTIRSVAIFGGNDIFVPEGMEVDLRAHAVFGSAQEHGSEGSIEHGSPLVRVHAFSLFGANDVRHVPAGTGKSVRELKLAAVRELLHGRASG